VERRTREGKWLLQGVQSVDDHKFTDMIESQGETVRLAHDARRFALDKKKTHAPKYVAPRSLLATLARYLVPAKREPAPSRARSAMFVQKEEIARRLIALQQVRSVC
jgi:hypothetical protein